MTKFLINSTEQVSPYQSDETDIILFGRSPIDPSERVPIRVKQFRPYFYAAESSVKEDETWLLGQDCISEIDYGDYESLKGMELARIYVPEPRDTRDAREFFELTWSADVPFTNRFRVDTELRAYVDVPTSESWEPGDGEIECHWREIDPVEPGSGDANPTPNGGETGLQNIQPRIATFDIETDDRGEGFPDMGEERMLSIVAHDNYDDEVAGFLDLQGRSTDDALPNGAPDNIDTLYIYDNEVDMLDDFAEWFSDKDPDLLTGWNADDFDIPYTIERMKKIGADKDALSPLGWAGVTGRGDPRIKGRTVYDLLTVYKKNSFTELRSYSLDDVAAEELDAEKIKFDGSFYELYENETEKFIEYNAKDVILTKDINEEAGVIEFRDTLRREVGVDFEDSYDNKDFVDMMCRRKLRENGVVGPTRKEPEGDTDFEGAFVFDAYKGVAQNVVGVDLASLYPYTMAMINASPETKVTEDFDGPKAKASNGQYFRLDKDGIFKQLVDEAISLKSDYKEKRNNAESEAEYEKWSVKYASAKTITNSLYGVTGWELFFLYDQDVAEAVTLTGQTVIKRTANYVEETGYEVIYGDTDSCYVKFPDEWGQEECLNTGRELCADLNGTVYPELAEGMGIPPEDNMWEIEVEAHMERFFQAGKKKRYAYLATWKDGHSIDDPEPSISGFSSKRSDSSKLTEETEERILDAILHGHQDEVGNMIFEAAKEITRTNPNWERIGIPGGMNQKIDPQNAGMPGYYEFSEAGYPQGAHPRAVWNANKILDVQITSSDKPMRVYLEPKYFDELEREINVIAFTEAGDMEGASPEFHVDVQRMTDTLLVSPLKEIASAVGVDINAAIQGQTQTGLGAF